MQKDCYKLLKYAQKIFGQVQAMRKTSMQGENVFGKNSHETLKTAGGTSKITVSRLLLCGNVGSEEKNKEKTQMNQHPLQCNDFLL